MKNKNGRYQKLSRQSCKKLVKCFRFMLLGGNFILFILLGQIFAVQIVRAERMYENYDGQQQEISNEIKEQKLYAKSAVLMDGDSGRVLYGKNENAVLAMASTTKIMTCIIALEYGRMDDVYTVSSYAASQPKVKLGAMTGEQYRMGDLLYSLMLESHNDAAVILAEGIAGSVQAFAALMNQKAEDLGCQNTRFVTPNGLDAQGHHTTAAELARIMKYCISESPKKEEFLTITRTISYQFSDIKNKHTISCQNHNALLSMMDGALSGKTGFTGNAGYCYVGAVKKDGKLFIVSLLACGWPNNRTYKWSDMKYLIEYALAHYNYKNIYEIQSLQDVIVVDGQIPIVSLRVDDGQKELNYLIKEGEVVYIQKRLPNELAAPVDKNKAVGVIEYYIGEQKVKQYFVYPEESVRKIDFQWCLNEIKRLFLLQSK
ncbi:MAG: D-alanyl-D-alanine carboxypeptidase family protein [Candidatus Fimimorpha sp.]